MNKIKLFVNGNRNLRITVYSYINERFNCILYYFILEKKSEFLWKNIFKRIASVFNDVDSKDKFEKHYIDNKFYDGCSLIKFKSFFVDDFKIGDYLIEFNDEFTNFDEETFENKENLENLKKFEEDSFNELSGGTEIYFDENSDN